MKGTVIAATEHWWPFWKLPECSALKTQMTAPRLLHIFLIYPPGCTSKAIVMSLNNIGIMCSPFSVGKALHIHRRATLIHLQTHWHPHQLFSTAMHKPCHHFHIPNSETVTYINNHKSIPVIYVFVYINNCIATSVIYVFVYICCCSISR